MDAPVVFLAFANNSEAPLDALKEEEDIIYNTLLDGESKSFYKLHPESFATPSSIARYLAEFKDRVVIFHYAGHAEGESLLLSEGEADSTGIVQLLKNQKNLKVVFLNGCSTQEQVKLLFEVDIPIVIATSCKINDNRARQFAENFYHALTKKHTIREAFDMAAGVLNSDKNRKTKVEIFRSASFGTTGQKAEEFPWGLYSKADRELEWKLPNKPSGQQEVTITTSTDRYTFSKTPVNKTLIEVLINAFRPYNSDLDYLLRKREEDEDEVDERKFPNEIINSLPAPIGEQLQALFALDTESDNVDKIGPPRIEQLVRTYRSLIEFVSFVLLSNIWDIRSEDDTLVISPELLESIRQMLVLNHQESPTFDYSRVVRVMVQWLAEANLLELTEEENNGELTKLPVFMKELKKTAEDLDKEEALKEAFDFFEKLKNVEVKSIPFEQLESTCVEGEIHLADLFKYFNYVAHYKMTTVKSINIRKTRNKSPRYLHKMLKLYKIRLGLKDTILDHEESFTDSRSVILLKSPKKLSSYLNLSPFVIDQKALEGTDGSKLFFYHYYDREKDELHYKGEEYYEGPDDNKKKDKLVITQELLENDNYKVVREEFDLFSEIFFSKIIKSL